MRQSILAIFIFSSLFINSSISNELKAQTVTTTIQYGGFVTTCCSAGTVDYFCFDSPSNTGYCGNTTTCNTQNFTDPVPAGNIVTQIAVSYTSAGCGGGVLTGSVNGTSLGSVTELNNGCPCTGLQWTPTGATTSNYPCGIVNAGITYNYGGLNSFQFCAAGQVCIDRAVLTISYVPASQASPATQPSAISGTTPICVGTAQNYSIPTVANAASYVWTVPAGWTINSGQGTTGINATSGSSGNICVTATNLCGTSAPTCYNVNVLANVNAGWTNPSTICAAAGSINLNSLITGTGGGTWSGTGVSGNTFNPSSGTQSVTYTVGTAPCQETSSQTITVAPNVNSGWTPPSSICANAGSISLTPLITGVGGGTWSGTGVTGTNFNPIGLSGNVAVTYTVGAVPCQESLVLNIQIDAEDDATFAYSPTTYCLTGSDPLPSSITTSGGTFTISGSGSINPTTGLIDLSTSGVGTFTITYNTVIIGNPCPNSTSIQVIITTAPTAVFSYDQATYCQDSANPVLTFGVGSSGGIFLSSPTGLSINSSTGAIDLLLSSPGVYTVTDTIAPAGGCAAASSTTVIEVLQVDSALFSYPSTFCLTGVNPLPTMGGNATLGGTFIISAPGVLVDPLTGEIDLVASGLGTFTVFYNTTIVGNACSALDSFQIIITNAPTAVFSYDQATYCQDSANPVLTFGV
ncbi:MAG: hypothetical protein HRT73_10915, partial [Flavobacteriales bacterium]|nr:hypothetical protein [Flavobacteriales bacterium]